MAFPILHVCKAESAFEWSPKKHDWRDRLSGRCSCRRHGGGSKEDIVGPTRRQLTYRLWFFMTIELKFEAGHLMRR